MTPEQKRAMVRQLLAGGAVQPQFPPGTGMAGIYEDQSPASMPPPPAPPQKQMMGQPDGYQSVFSDLLPQEQQAIAQALQAGLSVEDAFAEVLGVDMNAISRGQ